MQEVMRWNKGVAEYIAGYKQIRMKMPPRCKKCGCNKFYKWGKYERNVVEEHTEHRVPIARIRCVKCKRTSSLLPDFCISRVQYSAGLVLRLLSWLLGGLGAVAPGPPSSHESMWRRAYAYRRRFVRKETLWLTFLRERGFGEIPPGRTERFREMLAELNRLFGQGKLLCAFHASTGRHFMAK